MTNLIKNQSSSLDPFYRYDVYIDVYTNENPKIPNKTAINLIDSSDSSDSCDSSDTSDSSDSTDSTDSSDWRDSSDSSHSSNSSDPRDSSDKIVLLVQAISEWQAIQVI